MDPSVSKKTQDTLGKVIKKPPLTDKLLSKPPFRFLHDIITEVIRNTGVLKGLYTADEMNSANVKEKDAKVAFLQKAIDVVALLNGVSLSVRPSKIVAGHEPEKTNEFLQELAKAAIAKKNSADAVKTVLSGGKPGKSSGDSKSRKERSKSRDREIPKDKELEKKSDSGSSNKENKRKESRQGSGEERKKREEKEDSSKRENSSKKERSRDKERKVEHEKEKEKEIAKEKAVHKDADDTDIIDSGLIDGNVEEGESQQNRIPRPSSAKGQRRRHGDGDDSHDGGDDGTDSALPAKQQMNGVLHEDELSQQVVQSRRMARPSSARPAPPKIKKQDELLEEQNARIGSGKQVASVIVDDGKDDDDDETFVVEDTSPIINDVDSVPSNESIEDESSHGGLVRTILETKKELEGSKEQTTRTTQEKSLLSDAARQKERELAKKEIEKLRGSIQTLTRSANPLGKIMDYIQEDVDSMHKELEMWRTENRDHSIALKREQSITDNEIEPLKSQLEELESEITEMVDKISTVKCNILKNEEKIHQMLSSISFNSR